MPTSYDDVNTRYSGYIDSSYVTWTDAWTTSSTTATTTSASTTSTCPRYYYYNGERYVEIGDLRSISFNDRTFRLDLDPDVREAKYNYSDTELEDILS